MFGIIACPINNSEEVHIYYNIPKRGVYKLIIDRNYEVKIDTIKDQADTNSGLKLLTGNYNMDKMNEECKPCYLP